MLTAPGAFVVRVAGLPARVLADLRFRETSMTVERLAAGQEWLAVEGERLSARLHDVIGATADAAVTPRLVGLRRAIHRVRPPAKGEWTDTTRAVLPPDLRTAVHRWLDQLREWRQECARLAPTLVEEAARKQITLRDVAMDPGFRRALWQSSWTLTAELDKWLADPARRPSRQVLFRLAKYVARAATKTSPYSAFTVSGFGAWSERGPAVRLAMGWEALGVLELPGRVRERLEARVAALAPVRDSLPVRVNPSATVRAGTLSFLGPPPAEPVLTVPVTPALRYCLDILEAEQPMTLRTLGERLTPADRARDASSPLRFLTHLVDMGVLVLDPTPILANARSAGAADVTYALRRVETDLRRPVRVADIAEHRAAQRSLRETFDGLAARFGGSDGWPSDRWPVANDVAVTGSSLAECGWPAWRPVLDNLTSVLRWLAVFNSTLPLRLALAEVWSSRFSAGERIPFLDFHRAVREAAGARDRAGTELRHLLRGLPSALIVGRDSTFAEIRHLLRVREQALRALEAGTGEGLVTLTAGWSSWIPPLGSVSCYVQPLWVAGELSLVLNAVDCGFGRGRSRVAHLIARAGGTPPADAGRWIGDGTGSLAFAELSGAHGSTLNDRVPSLPFEIDYPFTTSARAAAERLPLRDLIVEYDPDRGLPRLRSARLGTEVKALDVGLMVRWLLPPAARLLVEAFGETSMILPFGTLAPDLPAEGGVRRERRLTAGRVVLRRARWIVGGAGIPIRGPVEGDAGYLLRLTAWRRANGIPPRCFVRALSQDPTEAAVARAGFDKERKPMYLDFSNWFLVLSMENVLRSSPAVVIFEEALPDPAAATEPADAPRATEFIIEVEPDA